MTQENPDPSHIMQIGMGFFASKTLLSAVELGVFAALGPGSLRGPVLAAQLGLHPRGAQDFLDALVALGLLSRDGDGPDAIYANTRDTAAFLDPASPAHMGGLLAMASQRLYPAWAHLTEALRTGRPQNEIRESGEDELFAALYADPVRLEAFVAAMTGRQRVNFDALADRFDFGRFRTLCDIGGAGAALSIAVARRHPGIACTSYDLAPVAPIARRNVAQAGLEDRIDVCIGDFMTEDLPPADVLTMGNILHDWGTATKRMLIAKAHAALPPGGALIVIEDIIDDARRQNASGLLMSLNMLIETAEGYNFSGRQFDAWCREAGFSRTEVLPLTGPSSAAIAWK